MEKYMLQSRWILEEKYLCYYGLRNKENLFKNKIKLNKKQLEIIKNLPKQLNENEKIILSTLIGTQIVTETNLKNIPKSFEESRFCSSCSANDFIIPGLEFDKEGRCPFCQTVHETQNLKSLVPLVEDIPKSKKSRFDVALFYTGGKDSTFLLYQLAKIKKLNVLALT